MVNPIVITGPNHHTVTLSHTVLLLIAVLVVWVTIWKGMALWRAGRNNQLAWFVVMLVVNTLGILEIVYLLFFQRKGKSK